MKNTAFIVLGLTLLVAGFLMGSASKPTEGYNIKTVNKIIELHDSLMRFSDQVMDNNQLWDKDGSDTMQKYLQYHEKIDNLYSENL